MDAKKPLNTPKVQFTSALGKDEIALVTDTQLLRLKGGVIEGPTPRPTLTHERLREQLAKFMPVPATVEEAMDYAATPQPRGDFPVRPNPNCIHHRKRFITRWTCLDCGKDLSL